MLHDAAEGDGDAGEGEGIHHVLDTAPQQELIHQVHAGGSDIAIIEAGHHLAHRKSLDRYRQDNRQQAADGHTGDGREFPHVQHQQYHHGQKKQRGNAEIGADGVNKQINGSVVHLAALVEEAQYGKAAKGSEIGGQRGLPHGPDMLVEGCAC